MKSLLAAGALLHVALLVLLPVVVNGVITRTKARFAKRRGAPIFQLAYDVVRLVRKRPVYSTTTTIVFRLSPYIALVTAIVSGALVPLLGIRSPFGFPFDFVLLAYLWGLGRFASMLGALDTGSSFEGMGASREATFSAILEPVFVAVCGAASLVTNERSFGAFVSLRPTDPLHLIVWLASVIALFIVVQVESSRMPVDDPATHLELTMVHEVMILDHSGPDLAAIQVAAATKLTVGLALLAALVNPASGQSNALLSAFVNVGLTLALAVVVGTIESTVSRLKLRAVPQYILVALVSAGIALLATTFRTGSAP